MLKSKMAIMLIPITVVTGSCFGTREVTVIMTDTDTCPTFRVELGIERRRMMSVFLHSIDGSTRAAYLRHY
jgi:hypothetical protein